MTLPRGIRNHNPGNIRRTGDPWRGLAALQSDPDFFTYETPPDGIRAMAVILQNYQEKNDRKTIREIIGRWAPPEENDTESYADWVARRMDTAPDEPINVGHYPTALALVKAITRMENGAPPAGTPPHWYTDAVFERGLRMAGISPTKALTQSRATRGNVAGAGGIAAAIAVLTDSVGLSPEVAGLLPLVLADLDQQTVALVLLAIGLGGALYSQWARMDDKKQGRL